MIEEKDVRVRVRDGVHIALRIYRPDGAGPFPALLAVSPYRYDNNDLPALPMFLWRETGPIDWYVGKGYAYVHADVRGTGFSEGEFGFMDKDEQQDLYDVIEWIAQQSWSNGKIGGIGQSYYCMLQWFMGIQNPPHLTCLGAYDGQTDPYRYFAYPGGIEGMFLPYWVNASLRVANWYPANGDHPRDIAGDLTAESHKHPLYDDWWKERSAVEYLEKIKVPTFSIGVWAKADLHLAGNIGGFLRAQGETKLAITAAPTAFASASDFATVAFHEKYLLPFYDHYLKGEKTSYLDRPKVEYIVKNTGAVRAFDTWPPPATRKQVFHLGPGPTGTVTSLNDGALGDNPAAGKTSYDYPNPLWVLGVVHVGPMGPDPVRGVLTFTSVPFEHDMEIVGNGKVTLYASTTRNDMDVIVKVSEQFPQNEEERAKGVQPRSVIVAKGWLRASHRERDKRFSTEDVPYYTHEKVTPLAPGEVYQLEVPLEPAAWRFKQGSRVRLEIACGDSAITDGLFGHIYRPDKIGTDTIHHDAAHPSQLMLPVLEGV